MKDSIWSHIVADPNLLMRKRKGEWSSNFFRLKVLTIPPNWPFKIDLAFFQTDQIEIFHFKNNLNGKRLILSKVINEKHFFSHFITILAAINRLSRNSCLQKSASFNCYYSVPSYRIVVEPKPILSLWRIKKDPDNRQAYEPIKTWSK